MLRLLDHVGLAEGELARLRIRVERLRTLEEVLRAVMVWSPPWRLLEVVTQDEYTLDVVFAAFAEGQSRYLVFDTT